MELNVSELDDNMYDQIPENIPVKITKKDNRVRFSQKNSTSAAPAAAVTTTVPVTKSVIKKVTRPQAVEQKPKMSYDDILSKMGMFVAEGELHLLDSQPIKVQEQIQEQYSQRNPVKQEQYLEEQQQYQNPAQNSYIYNKYFSNENQPEPQVRVPRTLLEYRNMLIQDILQKQKIKQMKSTKLIMPTSNINFAPYSSQNMNKLFAFSNR
jgi:hypothetical protein